MPISSQFFSFPAINQPSGGAFSFKAGQPTVIFSIPAQDRLLDVNKLRLVGKLVLKDSSGTAITIPATPAHLNENNGANIAKATTTNISPLTGVQGSISKVVIQSKKSRMELAQIVNYPEYLSTRQAYLHNQTDFRTMPNAKDLATGSDALFMSRRMSLSMSGGKPFSTPLQAVPLLTGAPLHLGESHLGGLIITLHLAPDSAFLSSYYRDVGGATNADPTGSSYELVDLSLEGQYLVPTAEEVKSYPKELALKSRLSLLNDLLSSVDSSVFTPHVAEATGFVSVYQTQDQENSYLRTQTDFKLPVGVEKVVQTKDGIQFPFKYSLEAQPDFRSSVENGTGTFDSNSLVSKCHGFGSAELQKVFERSLFQGREMSHIMVGLDVLTESLDAEFDDRTGTTPANDGVGKNMALAPFGLGSDQTFNIAGASEDYRSRDYQLRLTSGVATGNALLPADFKDTSYIQRQFVPHVEVMDTQTLMKSM